MGIQSATATFTRFFVPDPAIEDFWAYVETCLKAGCFREPDDFQEQTVGFATWEDFFDSDFETDAYHKGEYVAFSFRLDQRKVPSIVLKKFMREAILKYRAENEGRWPSRNERQEIQENMENMLMNRSLPQPSSCEVVWNPAARSMVVGATAARMLDAFLEHFEKHFRLYPVPLYHVHWALNVIPLEARDRERLSGMVSTKSPQALEEGRFLGNDFLTWLWFFIEQDEGNVRLEGGKEAQVHLGERMVLTLPGVGKERVVCTTQANALHEARTALRQGKLVDEIQLFLMVGDNEYLLTLDSGLWAVKGLKSPKQMRDFKEDDEDSFFLEKMFFLEEVTNALNTLYARFLAERLASEWDVVRLPEIKTWVHEGGAASDEPAGGEEGRGGDVDSGASDKGDGEDEAPF